MLRRGDVFAEYVIERELGRGSMGAVYSARHPRLPRLTALKLLHRDRFDDNEIRARFEREADLAAQLDHPNIITVFDRGIENEQLWISMQYVDGADTATVRPATMSAKRAMQIIIQTAGALDYAHDMGVLHRDVKPANILLSRSAGRGTGFEERVLLTDFGIVRLLDDNSHLTRTGMVTATFAYASPEQLSGAPVDRHSDQYSLACTLFRLLTGVGPFDAADAAVVILGHIQAEPPSVVALRPDLPVALDAVMARVLAKNPQDRYSSCTEFASAAGRALAARKSVHTGPTRLSAAIPLRSGAPRLVPSLNSAATPRATMTKVALSQQDIVLGCLLGSAVGDALGAPVENMLLHHIRQRYGPDGMTGCADTFAARISEETQLTLFTVEALIKDSIRARGRGIGGATVGLMQRGFRMWLQGQNIATPDQPNGLHSTLATYPELMSHRGISHAGITALQLAAARGKPGTPLGTRSAPINDSKGCAAVVRAAPCGFGHARESLQQIFELGCDAAALTHGNPSGWLPAGTLAAIIFGLYRGADLPTALDRARAELAEHDQHEATSTALTTAIEAAATAARRDGRMPRPEEMAPMGRGWVGPEALAIAVFAALCAETVGGTPEQIVRNGLSLAVNHSGDSDSTGAICGSILGASYGSSAIPADWHCALDATPIIERLAADYCTEFGPNPPSDAYGWPTVEWHARYFSG